ncbi:uncharacterized protein PAF06_016671 [Gastrophryne carolinensis]
MSPRAVMLLLAVACAMIIMEETEARVILPPDPNCDISAIWSCPCFPELASDTAIRPEDCLTRCIPECTCRDGYYKKDGVCVPYIKIGPVCGINERWSCPPCFPELNPDVAIKPAECWPECIPECICIDGYHKKDGVCVPITIDQPCGVNEIRRPCPACPISADIEKPSLCLTSCITECICSDGYYKKDGFCVPSITV